MKKHTVSFDQGDSSFTVKSNSPLDIQGFKGPNSQPTQELPPHVLEKAAQTFQNMSKDHHVNKPLYSDIKMDNLKSSTEEDVDGYVAVDKDGKLRKIEIPKSVNKSGYEIRLEILEHAIDWVKTQRETHNLNHLLTLDNVFETANKFYSFVEGKKGK